MFYHYYVDFAEWFVSSGYFGNNIRIWVSGDSRATTAVMRQQVAADLTNDSVSAKKISKMILQIVASCGEELQKLTFADWKRIIGYEGPLPKVQSHAEWEKTRYDPKTDETFRQHFVSEFKDYLNRITVCGVGTREACDFIISCIVQNSSGIFTAFQFNHERWKAFVDKNKTEQEHKADELQNDRDSALSEKREQLQLKIKEMEKLSLQDLIATCTDGLADVSGKAVLDTLNKMKVFKQSVLELLKEPTTLESNHRFLKLLEDTYRKISDGVFFKDRGKDDRFELANATMTLVMNILQKQRKMLEAARDAKSRETAPATPPDAKAEEKATPKPAVSWRERFNRWRHGPDKASHAHIRELLSRMQEFNLQTI
jgi:hypothetical protein